MMSEAVVGSWNALNAFGDEQRVEDALRIVEGVNADVLYLSEMALKDAADSDASRWAMDELAGMGYRGAFSNYSPPHLGARDEHVMSMWTRGDGPITHELAGERYTYATYMPALDMKVRGVHLSDQNSSSRNASAKVIAVDTVRNQEGGIETAVVGDFNAMNRRDPNSRIPRALGRVVGGIEVSNPYDRSKKLQRVAGKIIRVCRMADGTTMEILEDAGLRDADPEHQPTIGGGRAAFQLDHIMVTEGLEVVDFRHHAQTDRNGSKVSDHTPISATLRRR